MADQLLARQYVEFMAKGFENIDRALETAKKKLNQVEESAKKMKAALESNNTVSAALQRMSVVVTDASNRMNQFNAVIRQGAMLIAGPAAAAFGMLTGTVMGFVRAGLQGTVEGFRLQYAFQMLSREIAGIFLPIINKVVDVVNRVTGWFRRLSDAQQNMVMGIVAAGAAMLFIVATVPVLVAGIATLITSVLSLASAVMALDVTLAGIPLIIGVVVSALAALVGITGVATAGAGAFLATTDAGKSKLQQLGSMLEKVWNYLKPIGDMLMTQVRWMGQLWDISSKLADAIVRPFAKLFSVLSGGGNWLEGMADFMDRIANLMDDYVVPAFEALANVIEAALTLGINNFVEGVRMAGEAAENLLGTFKDFIPIFALMNAFIDNTRKSGEKEKNHRKPMPLETGFGDAVSNYKKIAEAGMRASVGQSGKKPEEKTADNSDEIKRIMDEMKADFVTFKTALDSINAFLTAVIGVGGASVKVDIMKILASFIK